MVVVPFRPRQRRVVRRSLPDVPHLARVCMASAILLYLSPWMVWLDILQDTDESSRHDHRNDN